MVWDETVVSMRPKWTRGKRGKGTTSAWWVHRGVEVTPIQWKIKDGRWKAERKVLRAFFECVPEGSGRKIETHHTSHKIFVLFRDSHLHRRVKHLQTVKHNIRALLYVTQVVLERPYYTRVYKPSGRAVGRG